MRAARTNEQVARPVSVAAKAVCEAHGMRAPKRATTAATADRW